MELNTEGRKETAVNRQSKSRREAVTSSPRRALTLTDDPTPFKPREGDGTKVKPKRTKEEQDFATRQGMKIRAVRNRRGVTQIQLCDFTGITADMVYRIERGEATASSFVLDAIANALDVSRDELFPKQGEVIELNPTTARLLFLIEPRHFRRPAFA